NTPNDPAFPATVTALEQNLRQMNNVVYVSPVTYDASGNHAIFQALSGERPQSTATEAIVTELRESTAPLLQDQGASIHVTGSTAANMDFTAKLQGSMPFFVLTVVLLSALILVAAFRSILLP